jgi:hypothetical protein
MVIVNQRKQSEDWQNQNQARCSHSSKAWRAIDQALVRKTSTAKIAR